MITQRLAPGRLAPGRRIYAIGDVHGCADRLFDLHQQIARHLAEAPCPAPALVHIGDLIDRGPDSARIVAKLAMGSPVHGVPMVNLMGNHEWMMLRALASGNERDIGHWTDNGGDASLESWGIAAGTPPTQWPELLPPEHLVFLRDLLPYYAADGYLFVHAGVVPGIALEDQRRHDLLWIREGFLDWNGVMLPESPEIAIVHGHTPAAVPEIRAHRLGIDTGAVKGGALTCAVLEANQVGFLQA